jgi:hypothetical protein
MNKIIFPVIIIALAVSCSKNNNTNNTPPTTSKGLMPLSVGNFWTYTKTNYDSTTGAAISTSSDEIDILAQVSVNNITYYQQNQLSITNIPSASFFVNIDSNTLSKIDSATQYTFFKRVATDSEAVDSWADTVTSRCKGHNYLYAFTDTTVINGYNCLRNVVYVNDCTGLNFEQWVYYLQPGLGFVRIQHYVLKQSGTFYLQFTEDLTNHHLN